MRFIKFLLLVLLITNSPAFAKTAWEKVKQPTKHKSQSIGSYANGCVLGAKALPLKGTGYEVIRSQRKRYYGHPQLVAYLQNLGQMVNELKLGTMLIGDMAMPAGGRFSKGHSSHQTGLDADIWLKLPKGGLSDSELSTPAANNVVNKKTFNVNSKWNHKLATLIKLAASDNKVQRIFVNPAIKRKLCETEKSASWLRKIRPWYGHNYHFHVRLKCPGGNSSCIKQKSVGWGSGCGKEVMAWDWRKVKKTKKKKKKTRKKKKIIPKKPAACLNAIN